GRRGPSAFRRRAPSLRAPPPRIDPVRCGMASRLLAVLLGLGLLAGCDCDGDVGETCASDGECALNERCADGVCVSHDPIDAGVMDGSTDAGRADGGPDACALVCGDACCAAGERCTGEGVCSLDLGPCTDDGACLDDSYCHEGRCTPYGTPPRGDRNDACRRTVQPGRFDPVIQCRWDAPPEGDPAPTFFQVESTALVADFRIGRAPDEPI